MTIQRTPEDNNLINTLQQTIAIKDAQIQNLHEALLLSRDAEKQLEKQIQHQLHTNKLETEERQLKVNILIRKIKELQDELEIQR